MKRGNCLISVERAAVRANFLAEIEKRCIYVCSSPPTFTSFAAPNASLIAVKRKLITY